MTFDEIVAYIDNLKSDELKKFQEKLIFTKADILGVKTPLIKEYAKKLVPNASEIIKIIPTNVYYETDLLLGLLISKQKIDYLEKIEELRKFAMTIDNWAVCDTIVCSTNFKRNELEDVYKMCEELINSDGEFVKRFGVTFLIKYFSKTRVNEVTKILLNQKYGDYYFDMDVAWYYSTALIHNFEQTLENIVKIRPLSEFVYQKSLQKGIESLRITQEQKEILRNYKKRSKIQC